jgi:hypothetical protein
MKMAASVQKAKSKPHTKADCGAARLQASSRITVCTEALLFSVRLRERAGAGGRGERRGCAEWRRAGRSVAAAARSTASASAEATRLSGE